MIRAEDEGGHRSLLAGLERAGRLGGDSDGAIRELVTGRVAPLISRLLMEAVERGGVPTNDVEDLRNEAVLRVIVKLRRLADDPGSEPIARLDDYIEAVFRHALDDHRRRLDPPRAKLANRVRYVLSHTRALAVWGRDPELCGLVEWLRRSDVGTLRRSPRLAVAASADAEGLRRTIEEVIREAGAPVDVRELIDVLASAVGLTRQPFVSAVVLGLRSSAATAGDAVDRLEIRQYLTQLWGEIGQLPVPQRRALLFNLRLDDGDSIARALAALGIVGVRQLAGGLEMPLDELLALWNELPLQDRRIAAMLGLSRQQVINLRKSARERLARRMGRPRGARRSGT